MREDRWKVKQKIITAELKEKGVDLSKIKLAKKDMPIDENKIRRRKNIFLKNG